MDNRATEIRTKISELKKKKTGYFDSNIFTMPQEFEDVIIGEDAVVYVFNDKGVKRVYFAACDPKALQAVLAKLPSGSGIEMIGKGIKDETKAAIEEAGFELFETYLRATIPNMKEDIYKNIPDKFKGVDCWGNIQYAEPRHAQEIYDLLYSTFDPFTSHLQSMEELMEDIEQKQFVVATEDDHVFGLMSYEYQGKKLYMEHAINRGPSVYMHSLYFALLEKAIEDGINVAYTWMRIDNDRILAFANRYGYVLEDIRSFAFRKK